MSDTPEHAAWKARTLCRSGAIGSTPGSEPGNEGSTPSSGSDSRGVVGNSPAFEAEVAGSMPAGCTGPALTIEAARARGILVQPERLQHRPFAALRLEATET